ncbi:hypothetical protein HMPREF0971_02917 [Segatella oris F0302]|uniref:Uncharacterized protein n=1 Tax=Segatella oris F0302 TaxID=649760 RepID=D1QVD9_9BACT|nr:hypothetical protein HMPREF0971_02917 [Segatella oris F0302]
MLLYVIFQILFRANWSRQDAFLRKRRELFYDAFSEFPVSWLYSLQYMAVKENGQG